MPENDHEKQLSLADFTPESRSVLLCAALREKEVNMVMERTACC